MRVFVFGAGGVGASFGAALAVAGHDVVFMARGAHAEAMRQRGLTIHGARGTTSTHVQVVSDVSKVGAVDVVMLAVKLWDLEATSIAVAANCLGDHTVVVTLQNGVDAPAMVAPHVGHHRVLPGVAYVNAAMEAPGVVRQDSAVQRLVIGAQHPSQRQPANDVALALRNAGCSAEVTDDPRLALWEKFLVLVPVSALTAVTRLPIGEVRSHPQTFSLLLAIQDEVAIVGKALGISDLKDEPLQRARAYLEAMPHGASASMAKDLARGARLELPWLSGRVAGLGHELGVRTPANLFVTSALAPFAMGRPSEDPRPKTSLDGAQPQ